MKSLTHCQRNGTTTEAKTMNTAGLDIELLTLYQSNMTRVERITVRHMAELDIESLTCCQGNEAIEGASTSIRSMAGQAGMKSLTACQDNKARIAERGETGCN